jgi:nitroreductase
MLEDRPKRLPTTQPDGSPLKPITDVVLDRRGTINFTDAEVPDEVLDAVLRLGAQAPSGYNFQPWRFVVVRDAENRRRLQQVAFNQPKVSQAPVVIIAVGMKEEWKETAEEVLREGARRGAGKPDAVEQAKQGAIAFVSSMDPAVWVNRHTMIAVTTMMLVAEAYGFDTAPMEGFDAAGVKREFAIPEEGEVVCLLAIGRAAEPDKPYTGRFPLSRIVYAERFGEPWKDK